MATLSMKPFCKLLWADIGKVFSSQNYSGNSYGPQASSQYFILPFLHNATCRNKGAEENHFKTDSKLPNHPFLFLLLLCFDGVPPSGTLNQLIPDY